MNRDFLSRIKPYVPLPLSILQDPRLKAADVMVYAGLESYVGDKEDCKVWPTHDELSARCGVPVRTIARSIHRLDQTGWTELSKRGQRGNEYVVKLCPEAEIRNAKLADQQEGEKCQIGRSGGNPDLPKVSSRSAKSVVEKCQIGISERFYPLVNHNYEPELEPKLSCSPDGDQTFSLSVIEQPFRFEEWFEEKFWRFYPRKVGRPAALKVAKREAKTPAVRDAILSGLYRQLPGFSARELQYIPHPATWLNQQRWQDEPEASVPRKLTRGEEDAVMIEKIFSSKGIV